MANSTALLITGEPHQDPYADDQAVDLESLEGLGTVEGVILHLDGDADLALLKEDLPSFKVIVIDFPNFADGRGFSLARALRQAGYNGWLRAKGHLIPDQIRHLAASGFDDLILSDDLAKRMPPIHWQDAAANALPNYQAQVFEERSP
jgi:uncharacterized protein (DUF934 family)